MNKSIHQAHLENGPADQTVTHVEMEIELNVSEAPGELQINTVSQHATKAKADRPKPTCHHCEKPSHYKNQCRLLRKQREQAANNQNTPRNKNSDDNNSIPDNNTNKNNNHNNYKNSNRAKKKPETVYLPYDTCG